MIRDYEAVMDAVRKRPPQRVVVAGAADADVLEALALARQEGFAQPILVGERDSIASLLPPRLDGVRVVHVQSDEAAADTAAMLVAEANDGVIMKGTLNTSVFLRGVLRHLKSGRLLSHLAAFQLPGADKLVFHTDGGMNVAPGLEQKKQILHNAADALRGLGYKGITVTCLAANEKVDDKMPATVDAAALAEAESEFEGCTIEGPIALDVALSPEAARHKGIQSRISGQVDLFLMPNIETGNVLGKALIYYAGAQMAGVVLGAARPVVLASRAENAQGKLHSLALACLLSNK